MSETLAARKAVLMIAYTNYRTDPRVIRAAEAAAAAGYDVDFLALKREGDPPVETIGGVRLIHLNQQRYRGGGVISYILAYLEFFLRCLLKATALHVRRRYAVVHVNNIPDFLVFCAIVPRLMGARLILDIHDPMPNTFASKFKSGDRGLLFRLLLWQEKLSIALCHKVITVQQPVKDHVLVGQHGIPASRIDVISNFPDDQLFALRDPGPSQGRLRLCFHGTILERYGLRTAVEGLARVRHRDRIEVKIIGEGDFSEPLKALIADLGVSDIVSFDNRMYPLSEIPARLANFDLGLVPLEISSITNYALPLKLLEYLSLGMSSVCVRNAAIAHYFGEDDLLYVEAGNPDALAALLDRLIEEPDIVERYRRRAIELRPRFVWSHEKARYVEILDELSGRGNVDEAGAKAHLQRSR